MAAHQTDAIPIAGQPQLLEERGNSRLRRFRFGEQYRREKPTRRPSGRGDVIHVHGDRVVGDLVGREGDRVALQQPVAIAVGLDHGDVATDPRTQHDAVSARGSAEETSQKIQI
jgi:hypothetical protein